MIRENDVNRNKCVIKVNDEDILKINKILDSNYRRVKTIIDIFSNLEQYFVRHKYNYFLDKIITLWHNKYICMLITKLIKLYKLEFKSLKSVFLSCSFGRTTNKLSSDIDLQFIYDDKEDEKYEEIICYILCKLLRKERDLIDSKFVINFDKELKSSVKKKIDDKDLLIKFKSINYEIKYGIIGSKKAKFILQYLNNKSMDNYYEYIRNNVLNENDPWTHSYKVLYGQDIFENMYNKIYEEEKAIVNEEYILSKGIEVKNLFKEYYLDTKMNDIKDIKRRYQSDLFFIFYKYMVYLRIRLIYDGYMIKYLDVYELYDTVKGINGYEVDREILKNIFLYQWKIKKFTHVCKSQGITYSLHKSDSIHCDDYLLDLYDEYVGIKELVLSSLERVD